ncbi:murein transglycosylase A [Magnetospirillum sp. UT-4]|uniref:murein transglycosylase A n=1 Tax=Magnetospirillum sp. UT-4 TaxID=2681467 RepID=UPI001382B8EC|nr:MltA domain-containing protein [Magnetospirillum sp. UT-4]CAA7621922.1 putative Membrane-bound lytic murein transglycosylase A [Magnetospirillum sp. UT-4]
MRRLAPLVLLAALTACAPRVYGPPPAPPPPSAPPTGIERLTLLPGSFDQLPGWGEDGAGAVLPALLRSCERMAKLPWDRSIGADGMGGTVADWHTPCATARRISAGEHDIARAFFEAWFVPYLATNDGRAEGTFTGYFEPELEGSLARSPRYRVPLLAKPKDLVTRGDQVGRMVGGEFRPYPSRAEIEAGTLGSLAQAVAWVADPVDAHIMHIQGSGRVRLPDGRVLRLGVAGTNGHRFVGIGKLMRERGLLDDISMPAIRAWLKDNPTRAQALMAENPRYVFYKVVTGDGPLGSEGVALTPERSLAVDNRYIPLGVPLFLDTVDPAGRPLRRLVMAQDTGGAIKGPVRGDFFWGAGEAAFEKAGRMKSPGRYWLLLPRQRSPRVALAE